MPELVAGLHVGPALAFDGLLELLAHERVDRRLVAGEEEPALGIGIAAGGVLAKRLEVVAGGIHGEGDELDARLDP